MMCCTDKGVGQINGFKLQLSGLHPSPPMYLVGCSLAPLSVYVVYSSSWIVKAVENEAFL